MTDWRIHAHSVCFSCFWFRCRYYVFLDFNIGFNARTYPYTRLLRSKIAHLGNSFVGLVLLFSFRQIRFDYGGDIREEIPIFGPRVWYVLMFGLFIHTVFDEESDFQVKIAQFQRPEVENRGSRFLIVGFLIVCLHRMCFLTFFRLHKASTTPR